MTNDKKNIMVILSSPSGVGKTTLTKKLQQKYAKLPRENKSLKLTYNLALKMTHNLVTQLNYLITQFSKTFLGFSLKNLIIIDKSKFVYLCDEFLLDIIKNGENGENGEKMLIKSPFTRDDFFFSPELLSVKEIPSFVNYKVSYFSLG